MSGNLLVKIKRSDRRSVGLTIQSHGDKSQLTVKAPHWMSLDEVKGFIAEKKEWIRDAVEKIQRSEAEKIPLKVHSVEEMKKLARNTIPPRVEEIAQQYGF